MKSVYEASTGLEAHMVLNLLQQEGIEGRVEGEYLQGGVGELATGNIVRVVVADADFERSRAVIREWESTQTDESYQRKPSRVFHAFVLGLILGAGAMYWFMSL